MMDGRGDEGSEGEAGSMEDDRRHYRQRGATTHLYSQKKKAARMAVDRARRSMEE